MSNNANKIHISRLEKKRFEALASYTRHPLASMITKELEWYANKDESILGVVLLDYQDQDFAYILLVRDEHKKYRCFSNESAIKSQIEARDELIRMMKWHTGQNVRCVPQGGVKGINLFELIVTNDKEHPYFAQLSKAKGYHPARSIISEMMPHFQDIDGNFVEQFQSSGFDSRLWELYLYSYLNEEEILLSREYDRPDFVLKDYPEKLSIEAVIVGRKKDSPPLFYSQEQQSPPSLEEMQSAITNEIPIRFGSPLFTKLKKEYWTLPHVKGGALVFAIADFHDDQSMIWTSDGLITYLYGVRHESSYDEYGNLIITSHRVDEHKSGSKVIPSGFFFQPDSENISAVLFTTQGTISKFNRMGRQAGFHSPNTTIVRMGACYDHDPNASEPNLFQYTVDESTNETWAEGLNMYHNPNAIHPVPQELFPSIAHHEFKDGLIHSRIPYFHPLWSQTLVIDAKE